MKILSKIVVSATLVALFTGIAIGCRNNTSQDVMVKGDYFFNFDEVVYYRADKKYPNIYEVNHKSPKTLTDSMTVKIMRRESPENISDTLAIMYLDSIGFEKINISQNKLDSLREIFRERNGCESYTTSCLSTYRDVYLLKKKGKVTGIVKLCYECGDMRFIGTKADVRNFGCQGEFGKLRKIVDGIK